MQTVPELGQKHTVALDYRRVSHSRLNLSGTWKPFLLYWRHGSEISAFPLSYLIHFFQRRVLCQALPFSSRIFDA